MNISEEIKIHFMSYADIPFQAEVDATKLNIEWGDGSTSIQQNTCRHPLRHLYQNEGLYVIRLTGEGISNVNVSRLSLTELILENCPALEHLNCAINELNTLDLSHCPRLEEITCNSNNLENLDFSHNPFLIQVNISHNLLKELDCSAGRQLQSLYCSYNLLTFLQLSESPHINHIDVYGNQLPEDDINRILEQLSHQNGHTMNGYSGNSNLKSSDTQLLKAKNWYRRYFKRFVPDFLCYNFSFLP